MITNVPLYDFVHHPAVVAMEKEPDAFNGCWARRYLALRKCLLTGPSPAIAGDMAHFPPLGPSHA